MSTEREREQYRIGYKHGLQAAISWLHERAKRMNDPHAEAVLNSAATNLGWDGPHLTNIRALDHERSVSS